MLIPSWFSEQLASDHGGKYRVRWSNALSCFLLEEKTARGISTPPSRLVRKLRRLEARLPGITEEKLEQARSGYTQFLQIRVSDRMPCDGCGSTIKLTPHAIEWATCPRCRKNIAACFTDLGYQLLEHLRYLSYERGGDERLLKDIDQQNATVEKTAVNDTKNAIGSMAREDFTMLHQIQSVGYTGKVMPGTDIPGVSA